MLGAVGDFFGVGRIDVGIIEQAGEKFCAEHARGGAIDGSFGDRAVVHLLNETGKGVRKRQLDVHAGVESHARGGVFIRDDVMDANEFHDAEIIGDDDAVESPLVAQNVGKQMLVAVRRDAVDFVVGGHHGVDVGFFDGGFERLQPIFADDALGIVSGGDVGAAFGLAVHGEVFRSSHDVRFVDAGAIALKAL